MKWVKRVGWLNVTLGCRGITLEDELTVRCNIHVKESESPMTTVQAPARIPDLYVNPSLWRGIPPIDLKCLPNDS